MTHHDAPRRTAFGRIVTIVIALGASAVLATDEDTPSGKLSLEGESVGLVIGANHGTGTLRYQGEDIPISAGGIAVWDVGATRHTVSGDVYDLHRIEDFDGTYAAFNAGVTVGGGAGAVAMKNQNGVRIVFVSTNQGLDVQLATSGIRLDIDRPAWAALRAERAAARAGDAAGRAESAADHVEAAVRRAETAEKSVARRPGAPTGSPTAGVRARGEE